MVSLEERRKDIIDLVYKLDISPTMYKNAVEKYQSVATYLEENGANADIYPQGSFALGTVVRPYSKDKDCAYDLDFICQLRAKSKADGTKAVKDKVGEILESSGLYGGKLSSCDECFTIEYADTNDIGFTMDIIPAVDEDAQVKNALKEKCTYPDLVETSIAIPKNDEWLTNNPKGYKVWFDSINEPFKTYNRDIRRRALFESARNIYASIEAVPDELERSSLQRVVQILKHHRNVYFSNRTSATKPISAIITTLAAQIAKSAPNHYDVLELLDFVVKELTLYSEHQSLNEAVFKSKYPSKSIIIRNTEGWKIENPANPNDNLADAWNQDINAAKEFFVWISAVTTDLVSSLQENDAKFRTLLESAFGYAFVSKSLPVSKYSQSMPTHFIPEAKKSPWRNPSL
ncbi:MAG: hypothetical protein BWY15_02037 [Firmicutes bacterium ADurb.Bin193]|nr:MAG: hypothetical protein BWY15_02037 [Firmicutes bacterium ADurb.Bin193]